MNAAEEIERAAAKALRKAEHARRRAWLEREIAPRLHRARNYAVSLTRNWHDAEDVVQDSVLDIINWLDAGKPVPRRAESWLINTTRLIARNNRQKVCGQGTYEREYVLLTESLAEQVVCRQLNLAVPAPTAQQMGERRQF